MKNPKDPLAASKLAQTILKTNPGIDRVTDEKLVAANKLYMKKLKMSEHHRKLFINKLENRRKKRRVLYNKLKPKLDPSTRSVIEMYKVECKKTKGAIPSHQKRQKSMHQRKNLVSQPSIEFGKMEDNLVTSYEETETQDLSRRSSLRSSILEVTRSASPEDSECEDKHITSLNGADEKPEVVVTKVQKSKENCKADEGKIDAFMHLIPAPTPTRFVGKMSKVRENKKKMDTLPLSRKSSILPVNDTIEEVLEVVETKSTENSADAQPSESKSSARLGAKKILGSLVTNVRKASISTSIDSSKSTPANSVTGVSSVLSKKTSEKDKDKKKSGSGLSKFKTGFFGKGKKKVEKDTVVTTGKEMKQRLFFREKKDLTDDEILQAIGEDDSQKVIAQSMDEIASAATVMKKFLSGKRPPSATISCNKGSRSIPGRSHTVDV